MPFSKLGVVGLGQEAGAGSPRGDGQYANLGSNNHGTVLLASNLYMDDGNDNLKIANNHTTMAGAAIQIPGNGQPRQSHIEFWIAPPHNVNQGQAVGNIDNLRVIITPAGDVGIGTQDPQATVQIGAHPGRPNEEVWIDARDPNSGITAFTRLRAVTSNGLRESQLLFGGECSFVWLPSSDATGGGDAKNTLTLLVNTDNAGNVTARLARFDADIVLRNDQGGETIRLDREAGDIILQNADCAEDFDIASCDIAEPGTVMVLGDDGKLHLSTQAYDRRVAGVISGAGLNRPGLVLDRQKNKQDRQPIALMGKTFCKVDASHAPIGVGDLLTTADIPGFAMKALDPMRAFGAILGKALHPLESAHGLIPILVTLQ